MHNLAGVMCKFCIWDLIWKYLQKYNGLTKKQGHTPQLFNACPCPFDLFLSF